MITFSNFSVFDVEADCIVNTINCDGFMGKGLALEFALRYPELEDIYKKQCANKEIKVGHVYFYEVNGQKIINFPTKDHYQYPSKIEWIDMGLLDFVTKYRTMGIKSIAFPILGGSNGGLNHQEVIDTMKHYLNDIDLKVIICLSKEIGDKEKDLVDKFKSASEYELENVYELTKKQVMAILEKSNSINRLSDIREIKGIGKSACKRIYDILLNNRQAETVSLI